MTTFYFVRHGHMDTSMAGKKFYKDFSYNMMSKSLKIFSYMFACGILKEKAFALNFIGGVICQSRQIKN